MKTAAFTLLEVIIYCALFSLLMTSTIVTVYELMSSSEANLKSTNAVAEATFMSQKLSWAFYGATDVQLINSKTIKIIRQDLGTSSPLIVSEVDGSFYLARGTGSYARLTGRQFVVSAVTMSVAGSKVSIDYTILDMPLRFETYLH